MNTENVVLMRMARESLRGKWGIAVGTTIIYLLITGSISAFTRDSFLHRLPGVIISLIIGGPFMLGLRIFALSISRGLETRVEFLFEGFKHFGKALVTYLLMILFIFLWSLLLIIPGIVAAISFAMTFFILADDRNMGAFEALEKSKKMMYGYKWQYLGLCLRFFGWALLCLLTAGIGFFWLVPYMQVSYAKFYEELKANEVTPITAEAAPEAV